MNGTRRIALIFVVLLALAVSVSAGDPPKDTPPESKWADKVKPAGYPDAEVPDAYELRWDFSGDNITTYSLSLETAGAMGTNGNKMQNKNEVKGNVIIKAKGDNTATMIQKNMVAEMTMPMGDQKRTMKQTLPTTVVTGMLEDSGFDDASGMKDPTMGSLFPLPSKILAKGEVDVKPAVVPLAMMGNMLKAEGKTTFTLRRFVKTPDGSICAEIEIHTAVDEVKVPEEVSGKYDFFMRLHGIYYFDTARREFHSGELAGIMTLSMEAPGFDNKMSKMDMLSDTYAAYKRAR